jgi:hypothetical protein
MGPEFGQFIENAVEVHGDVLAHNHPSGDPTPPTKSLGKLDRPKVLSVLLSAEAVPARAATRRSQRDSRAQVAPLPKVMKTGTSCPES